MNDNTRAALSRILHRIADRAIDRIVGNPTEGVVVIDAEVVEDG